ncbi:MAG: NAD(P)/FAD-dependent oxidoreductase [Deltaproteobacteria bacterium]|nr:NAD(P)/FAD-dependent oxidoreductase [Deltaproteobacteria bacterium]MBW1943212.1 NAD(P)/FAD-dependent oxidoreductase [Deltaproteobacteria bacterium]MBW2206716.1 NAD(P)/FAD-dependent oxidoreductase [Deltaproteobacteria bacterium]
MTDFDIIVIGGGPAGCYAGLTAAAKGCRVAIFEEHRAIGWPRHDPGWLMESTFAKSIIDSVGSRVPWSKVNEYRVSHAESGDPIENSSRGGYVVRRDLLEKEIAASAIKAGAVLFLQTEVTKLVRSEGRVEKVETNSRVLPKATGQIFICADGIRSAGSGFAAQESLCEKAGPRPGISYLLANADVSAGVIDHFLSSDPTLNYKTFFTHQKGLCYLSFPTSEAFHELKNRSDNAVSRKIREAYPLEISGYASVTSGKYAEYFKNMVRDNILFVGDASGGAGNIHGMIQGQFAGTVAASAIKEHDLSEARLSEYQDLIAGTLGKAPFFYFSAREDFGAFDEWFRQVEDASKGMEATELAYF